MPCNESGAHVTHRPRCRQTWVARNDPQNRAENTAHKGVTWIRDRTHPPQPGSAPAAATARAGLARGAGPARAAAARGAAPAGLTPPSCRRRRRRPWRSARRGPCGEGVGTGGGRREPLPGRGAPRGGGPGACAVRQRFARRDAMPARPAGASHRAPKQHRRPCTQPPPPHPTHTTAAGWPLSRRPCCWHSAPDDLIAISADPSSAFYPLNLRPTAKEMASVVSAIKNAVKSGADPAEHTARGGGGRRGGMHPAQSSFPLSGLGCLVYIRRHAFFARTIFISQCTAAPLGSTAAQRCYTAGTLRHARRRPHPHTPCTVWHLAGSSSRRPRLPAR